MDVGECGSKYDNYKNDDILLSTMVVVRQMKQDNNVYSVYSDLRFLCPKFPGALSIKVVLILVF